MRSYAIRTAIAVVVAAVALYGCGDGSGNGPQNTITYTLADLEGYWSGQTGFTINGVPGESLSVMYRFDAQGKVLAVYTQEEDSVGGQLAVTKAGVITGDVVSYDDMYLGDYLLPAPVEFSCTGHFLSKSELTMACSASCTDTSGADVILIMASPLYERIPPPF
jgi:hypothetical protein